MDRLPSAAGTLNLPTERSVLPGPVRYLPCELARQEPNIVVDGAPLPSTVLTLSHWPNNQSPPVLQRDTSTATVFAWLDSPGPYHHAPFVTSNHFDEDGLFSMFAVVDPATAMVHRTLLCAGALAGDFGVVESRDAARLCFSIEAFSDPQRSPLPSATFAAADRVAALFEAMLPRLPAILERLADYRDLWVAQDEHLATSRALVESGAVSIEEVTDLDLAIIALPTGIDTHLARRYLRDETAAIHPFAINTATARSRILRIQDQHYSLEYRYEGWVRLATRRVALRVHLDDLRDRLNDLDPAGPTWTLEKPTEIAPRLYRADGSPSALPADLFVEEARMALASAPVAWDPYDWQPE